MLSAQPTLLVFTLGPAREARRKRLLPARFGATERDLHRAGLEAALAAGREAGCRVVVSSPDRLELPPEVLSLPQGSGTFGERLAEAMGRAAGQGPLLVVGTDVPDLSVTSLFQALALLARQPDAVVLGPSPDGGIYLLAGQDLDAKRLGQLPWCRRSTRRALTSQLREENRRVLTLEPLGDLDQRADLERWLACGRPSLVLWASLIAGLRRLLALWRRPLPLVALVFKPAPASSPGLGRAPPLLCR